MMLIWLISVCGLALFGVIYKKHFFLLYLDEKGVCVAVYDIIQSIIKKQHEVMTGMSRFSNPMAIVFWGGETLLLTEGCAVHST